MLVSSMMLAGHEHSASQGGIMPGVAQAPRGRIFISYRRDDAPYSAGWLYEKLVARFGRKWVFKDGDSIELGDNFAEVIAR